MWEYGEYLGLEEKVKGEIRQLTSFLYKLPDSFLRKMEYKLRGLP
jgi:hypothetical protein